MSGVYSAGHIYDHSTYNYLHAKLIDNYMHKKKS